MFEKLALAVAAFGIGALGIAWSGTRLLSEMNERDRRNSDLYEGTEPDSTEVRLLIKRMRDEVASISFTLFLSAGIQTAILVTLLFYD